MLRRQQPHHGGGCRCLRHRPLLVLPLLLLLLAAALTLQCVQAFMAVPQRASSSSINQQHQQQHVQRVRRLAAAAAASGHEGDGGGGDGGDSGMDEAGRDLGGRFDGWGSDAAGSRGYTSSEEGGGGSVVADRVQEYEEEEDPEEAALKERVLRRVAELRREQAATGGLLAGAFDGAPDADLGIEPLPRSGQANRAFKVFDTKGDDAVFVKWADVVQGLDGKATLTNNRLRSEFHGYEELAKHVAHMVPRAYVVDELESLIIVEYLSDYKSFVDLLRSGQVSAGQESVAIQVSQLLGRYHGSCVENAEYNTPEYRARFSNDEHVQFFKSNFVLPLTNTLNDPAAFITKPYLADTLQCLLWGYDDKTGQPNRVGRPGQETEEGKAIRWAVRRLQRAYEFKKQSLVHGDTHAQNILIKGEDGQGPEVKLVDAEKSMIGPCGFDMGLFLTNLAFYMSQYESHPKVQSRLAAAMTMSWAHYERELLRAMSERNIPPAKAQDVARGIFNDAIGFMGLWLLFLTTSNPVDLLPFDLQDPAQLQTAHSNLLRMSAALLLDYQRHRPLLDDDEHERFLEEETAVAAAEAANQEQEDQDPEAAAAAAEAAARRKLLGLMDKPAAKQEPEKTQSADPVVFRGFAGGNNPAMGRTRGNSGFSIPGNSMAHVVELLREHIVPLPEAGGAQAQGGGSEAEEEEEEEEAYMREVVLPADPANPSATRRDPVVFQKDKTTRKWVRVGFGGEEAAEEEAGEGVVDERAMLMRHQQAQLQRQLDEAMKEAETTAAASASPAAQAEGEGNKDAASQSPPLPSESGDSPGGVFIRFGEDMDEDVGKLRKMLNENFPAFSAWPQILGGVVAPAEEEKGEEEDKEAEEGDDEPLMLGGAGFTAPKFTPFPHSKPSTRPAAPPVKRQSWGSRGGKGGEGGAAGGGNGGRRKKK